jgi:threonyl-tRNA synthetase
VVSQSQTFHRLILSKEQALELFRHNPFKVSLISNKIADGGKVTAYKCGDLIDLCTGPHIPSTKMVKAFKVMKNSSAYWLGDAQNDSLQRIYGVSFPSKKELDEYIHFKEEAEKRDHRTIGRQQKLFDTHEYSPGSSFFYPNGMKIYEKLISMIKDQYKIRGYHEVLSPNIFNLKLWKTSGHYQAYKENIFAWQIEAQGFGMKPMNCPGHCLIFDHEIRSYRDLPLRLAEFGVLHRNEISGALSGLTRVRRFVQDDAHLFCTMDQIEEEVLGCLDFLDYIYKIFGFSFELQLSTRPEERLGSEEEWDKAEDALAKALDRFGRPWTYNHGDGAFYGPKIDIKVYDALRRQHQCGTVQCDFQLPIRFNLQYQAENAAEE